MRFNLNDALSGLAVLRTTSGNAMCHRAAPYPREAYAFEIHGLPCDLCGDTVHAGVSVERTSVSATNKSRSHPRDQGADEDSKLLVSNFGRAESGGFCLAEL